MDTFDVRRYITENKINEDMEYHFRVRLDNGEEHTITRSTEGATEKEIKNKLFGMPYADGIVVGIKPLGKKPAGITEEKDVIEPEDVPEKEEEEDTKDSSKSFKEVRRYAESKMVKLLQDLFSDDYDYDSDTDEYQTIKYYSKPNILKTIKSMRENSEYYNDMFDDFSEEEAFSNMLNNTLRNLGRNIIKKYNIKNTGLVDDFFDEIDIIFDNSEYQSIIARSNLSSLLRSAVKNNRNK